MSIGSNNLKRFKPFQIRWKEKLGIQDDPYLIRWTFCFFGYSIRIHHWLKTDASNIHFHDHAADLLSIVIKGKYNNVVPKYEEYEPLDGRNEKRIPVEGIFNSPRTFFNLRKSIWFSKAEQRHYLELKPGQDAWTLMFEGRSRHKWGFYVARKGSLFVRKIRPLEYFHRYGTYVHRKQSDE